MMWAVNNALFACRTQPLRALKASLKWSLLPIWPKAGTRRRGEWKCNSFLDRRLINLSPLGAERMGYYFCEAASNETCNKKDQKGLVQCLDVFLIVPGFVVQLVSGQCLY